MNMQKVLIITGIVAAFAFWTKRSFAASATADTKGVTRSATVGASPINSSAVAKLQDKDAVSVRPTVRLASDPVTGARLLPVRLGLPPSSTFQNPKARVTNGARYPVSNAAAYSAPLRPDYAFNYRSTVAPSAQPL